MKIHYKLFSSSERERAKKTVATEGKTEATCYIAREIKLLHRKEKQKEEEEVSFKKKFLFYMQKPHHSVERN
jgi:hypothetical protein